MFRFENGLYLYALIIIPLMIAGYWFLCYLNQKKWNQFGESRLINKLMPERSTTMQHLKFGVLMLALSCFIIALANPQIGSSLEKGKKKGVDIMICMDVSNSMMAQDFQPNRLAASKMALSRFIDQLNGDRIGLVIFAGKSFVQLPITSDYAAAKMFINYVDPSMINTQGTDIASAIDLAAVSMIPEDKTGKPDLSKISKLNSKVIVVVSDGEDHFTEAVEVAQQVKKMGVVIHTIGMGSTKGEPIPTKDKYGNINYKKDAEGNTVITRLNEAILKEIAQAGGGVYVHASNANMGFEAIAEKIDNMFKSDQKEVTFSKYDSKYQIPLLFGLFFLILEALLFAVRPKWRNIFTQFQQRFVMKKTLLLIPLLFLITSSLKAQTLEEIASLRKGNSEYAQAEKIREEALQLFNKGGEVNQRLAKDKLKTAAQLYQKAEINFRKSMATTPNYSQALYNLANTLYRQEKYEEAGELYQSIAENNKNDKKIRSKSYHNSGNSLLKQEKYKESIDAYKNALKIEPNDKDTKYNLEYAKQKMIKQQQQQQQQQDQKQDQKQDQQQDQKQDQKQQGQEKQDKQQQQQQQQQKDQKESKEQKQAKEQEKEKAKEDKRQLDALQQNEKNTQEKIQRQQEKGKNTKQEKDW